jgi:alpha-tubulin suppressor-like RCC1 family protein
MRRDEARRSRISTLAWLAAACALVLATAVAAPASSLAAKVLDWGSNSIGQLGNGTTTNSDVPVVVTGLGAVKKLAEDGQSAYAVLKNGTVDAWGDNQSGELGQGPSEHEQNESLVPEPVKGISGVTAIAGACHTAIARLSTGTVDVWGAGGSGQLAQGEKEESRALEPIPVKGLTEVKAVAAGCGSLYALKKNGTVMAWGDNEHGQLGNGGPPGYVKEPVAVKGLKGVSAIAAGRFFALALVKGTVRAWGEGSTGELGNGEEKTSSNVPVAVSGLTGVKAIAGGGYNSLALMSDTTVKSWGLNNVGQLGTGAVGPEFCEGVACAKVPTAVSGLTEVKSISTGVFHGYALLKNKTVKAWGDDEFGQLGNGEVTLYQPAPVSVSGLTGVVMLAVGGGGENFDSLAAT